MRDYFNKTAPAILLEKIIQSYAQTTSSDHSCDRLVDMKERCEKFYATLSSEAENGLAGLLFEIALFKSAIAQFHLETNSKTAADIAKKRVYAKNTSSFYEKNSASVLFKLEQESSMFRASFEANIAKLRTPDEVLKFIANIEDILNDERLTNSDKKDLLQTLFEEMTIEDPRLLRIFKAYRILGSDGNLNAELFPKQEKRLGLCS